jgi:hypothetical protein
MVNFHERLPPPFDPSKDPKAPIIISLKVSEDDSGISGAHGVSIFCTCYLFMDLWLNFLLLLSIT